MLIATVLVGCNYPSNVANDLAHAGNPIYDACRQRLGSTGAYGARCARETDPKVIAAREQEARQIAEQRRLEAEAAQRRVAEQERAESAKGYSRTTVRDFVLDGRELAQRVAKRSVTGVYLPIGNYGLLFSERIDAIQFASGHNFNAVSIPLITENASREFRSQLLACRGNPASSQIGCEVRVLGTATTCAISTRFQTRRDVPCIAVDEGSF